MKISINTETEEIAELRAAVAIIEDAIKRREGGNGGDEESYDYDSEAQTEKGEISSYEEPEPIAQSIPEREIEQPVPEPIKQPIPERKVTPPPTVDMSALSKSTYGERVEKRNMGGASQPIPQQRTQPIPQQRTIPQSQPPQNNKAIVRGIIQNLKDRNRGSPIQMTDIMRMAREKRVGEDETRRLVQELQRESSI